MSHLEPEELIFSEVNSSGSAVHGLFRQPVVVTMKEAREPPFFREVESSARFPDHAGASTTRPLTTG